MLNVLIIDDEKEMLISLEKILSSKKIFNITTIQDPKQAIEIIKSQKFDLILTDLKMNEYSGIDMLKYAKEYIPESKVIMISGYGTIEASVEAMQLGAFDFIEKPFTSKKLFECIDKALQAVEEKESHDNVSDPIIETEGIIYKSSEMKDVLNVVRKIAPQMMNVLIVGESGTGKELIARVIHKLSNRHDQPFVPVNCGALPENLFESELFGHERGAFTGAVKTKPGLLEFANQGTFFFDEIGDMSLPLQIKLLRMLEDRKIRRVGGQKEIDIDVRIIAATNKDLEKEVASGNFREDLFYRLNTIQVQIPPLRERIDDIMPLLEHYLSGLCEKENRPIKSFSPEAKELLKSYHWPGNVRELQNMIGRAYYLCTTSVIQKEDLPKYLISEAAPSLSNFINLQYKEAKEQTIAEFETEYLSHHLKKNQGNISKTAMECGLDRRSLHRLITKYNIIYKED
ncbi:MAG: sigma-54-dependent Fis family transcriptional regulator [Ignavibacteriales bacterium]|nr:sigma-54-dependent Fis family transcriptional regulator [Ignavibacteriales bacterium]MCB9209218.1 sigma-54-dependent Fis family transcriptional regulator [Ignavibacteriales bacterium]MCB9219531.1 sigma-54-dependent Fis family transcriptional regulator [Ignavibacteriales bacterium]MCB9257866.1 sigma-54-dependent Fis family transcriptional regulator [Ignavibacteriales bacterium]